MPLLPALSIHNLSFAGQLLVWSGRLWIAARPEWYRAEAEFSGPLGPEAGTALAGAIDRLFLLINTSARRRVCFAPGPCRRVADDELILVSAVRFAQDGDLSLAADAVADLLPPSAVRRAVLLVTQIADILSDNGYRVAFETAQTAELLDEPDSQAGHTALAGHHAVDRPKPTLH